MNFSDESGSTCGGISGSINVSSISSSDASFFTEKLRGSLSVSELKTKYLQRKKIEATEKLLKQKEMRASKAAVRTTEKHASEATENNQTKGREKRVSLIVYYFALS